MPGRPFWHGLGLGLVMVGAVCQSLISELALAAILLGGLAIQMAAIWPLIRFHASLETVTRHNISGVGWPKTVTGQQTPPPEPVDPLAP